MGMMCTTFQLHLGRQQCVSNQVFPNLFKFWDHLLIKLNQNSQILKTNPTLNFNTLIDLIFGEQLMIAWGALVVPGAALGTSILIKFCPAL